MDVVKCLTCIDCATENGCLALSNEYLKIKNFKNKNLHIQILLSNNETFQI